MKTILKHSLLILLCTICSLQSGKATHYTWKANIGQWVHPWNWSPYGIPGQYDTVTIPKGESRIQGTNHITVACIEVENAGRLNVYPNARLTINKNNSFSGPGLINEGHTYIHGNVLILNTIGADGHAVLNDNDLFVMNGGSLNMHHISGNGILNKEYGEIINHGTLGISVLEGHGLYNEGSFSNNGNFNITMSPLKHKWGIINKLFMQNLGAIDIQRANANSQEEGAIRTEDYFLSKGLINISSSNRYGIKVTAGDLELDGLTPFFNTCNIENCGTYGLDVNPGARVQIQNLGRLDMLFSNRINCYIRGSLINHGKVILAFSRFADLHISTTGNVENYGRFGCGLGTSSLHKSIVTSGYFHNYLSGVLTTDKKIKTILGSDFVNEGTWKSFFDSNHALSGNKIQNDGLLFDLFDKFGQNVVNNGVILNPYSGILNANVTADDFFDVANSTIVNISTEVIDQPGGTVVGHYELTSNKFTANNAGIGLDVLYFNASLIGSPLASYYPIHLGSNILPLDQNEDAQNRSDMKLTPSLSVYPNPSTDHLKIKEQLDQNARFQIFNESGKLVKSGTVQNQRIETLELSSGNYILKILNAKEVLTDHFIKI